MDIATIIGLIGGFAAIFLGVISSGSSVMNIVDVPSIFVTVGGSYFSLFIAAPLNQCLALFKIMGRTFKTFDFGEKSIVQNMVSLSEKARREGILALEEGLDDLVIVGVCSGKGKVEVKPVHLVTKRTRHFVRPLYERTALELFDGTVDLGRMSIESGNCFE